MAQSISRNDLVVGVWSFSSEISEDELVQLAKSWVDSDPDYLQICVRGTSRTSFGIQFVYRCGGVSAGDPGGENQAYKKWFYKMTDQLKRRFGNDLASWDISQTAVVIEPTRSILRP